MSAITITTTVNGKVNQHAVEPRLLLSDYLRETLALKGTHVGCEHGVCGTCTVLLNGESVRSCLMFAVQADGAQLRTVESLAAAGQLNELQDAFWEKHGLQCGFCTPAMLLVATELLERHPDPQPDDIREAVSANLCRCTGYYNIIEAVQTAIERLREARS